MRRQDFTFALPEALIAQQPLAQRSASRLLHLPAGSAVRDRAFTDLPSLLRAGDLLLLNDTRVIRARLRGRRASGGRIEALIERLAGDREALVQLRGGKSLAAGARLEFAGGGQRVMASVGDREGEFFRLHFDLPLRGGWMRWASCRCRRTLAAPRTRSTTVVIRPSTAAIRARSRRPPRGCTSTPNRWRRYRRRASMSVI